jgi:hypothetical protein
MSVSKPYRRTFRQFVDGQYSEGGRARYVRHAKFAVAPEQYLRAFGVIQKDLLNLFDYVEPASKNLECYSYRIHELFMRICIEIEANCKAILLENGYRRAGDWNVSDYKGLNRTHCLSMYKAKLPVWHGEAHVRTPFAAWNIEKSPPWYRAYNEAKHDRHEKFHLANFDNLIEAACGLIVLLSAQFGTDDLSRSIFLGIEGPPDDGFEVAIGGYFLIQFPDNWPEADRYDFDWQKLKDEPDPFQLAFAGPAQ